MKAIILSILALAAFTAQAVETRSAVQVRHFRAAHPCPATGARFGACPGYVVYHKIPLFAGCSDSPANMQWQEYGASKKKDAGERAHC